MDAEKKELDKEETSKNDETPKKDAESKAAPDAAFDENKVNDLIENETFDNIMTSLNDISCKADDNKNDDEEEEGNVVEDNFVTLDEANDEEDENTEENVKTSELDRELKELDASHESLQCHSEGEDEFTTHPYAYLVDTITLSEEDLTPSPLYDIRPLNQSSHSMIFNKEALKKVVTILRNETEIAVDVHQDNKAYKPIVSILSISTKDTDYVIDNLQLKGDILLLTEIFINPKIVKVISRQNLVLPKLHQINLFPVNVFTLDTAERALYNKPFITHFKIKTEYGYKQTFHNKMTFLNRPLPNHILEFTRVCTHYLLHLYIKYKNKLIAKGVDVYKEVVNKCNEQSKSMLKESEKLSGAFRATLGEFKRRQKCEMEVFIKLNTWRNEVAKKLNIKALIVLNNAALKKLSVLLPTKFEDVIDIVNNTDHIAKELPVVLDIIKAAKRSNNVVESGKLRPRYRRDPPPVIKVENKPLKRKLNDPIITRQKQSRVETFPANKKQFPKTFNESRPYKNPPSVQNMNQNNLKKLAKQQMKMLANQSLVNQTKINPNLLNSNMIQGNNNQNPYFNPNPGFNQNQMFPPNRSNFHMNRGPDRFNAGPSGSGGFNSNDSNQMSMMNEAVLNTALEVLKQNRDTMNLMSGKGSPNFNPNRRNNFSNDKELNTIDQRIHEIQRKVSYYQHNQQGRRNNNANDDFGRRY